MPYFTPDARPGAARNGRVVPSGANRHSFVTRHHASDHFVMTAGVRIPIARMFLTGVSRVGNTTPQNYGLDTQ
jgi:hypothetical protein